LLLFLLVVVVIIIIIIAAAVANCGHNDELHKPESQSQSVSSHRLIRLWANASERVKERVIELERAKLTQKLKLAYQSTQNMTI